MEGLGSACRCLPCFCVATEGTDCSTAAALGDSRFPRLVLGWDLVVPRVLQQQLPVLLCCPASVIFCPVLGAPT